MTDFFMDTDAGSDANNGTTWALAKLTLEGLLAAMSAGDRGWIQGAATDTAAVSRTLTSPGTIGNPCIITGVVDGTTNEPPVLADLAVTLLVIQTTVSTSDITVAGFAKYVSIHFDSEDRFEASAGTENTIINGKLSNKSRAIVSNNAKFTLINSVYETNGTGAFIAQASDSIFTMLGGSFLFTVAIDIFRSSSSGSAELIGVDIGGLTNSIVNSVGSNGKIRLRNCKVPASLSLFDSTPITPSTYVEVIASSAVTSVGATSSIADYVYQDAYGTVDAEFAIIRTGGADDGASGAFAHAMTPHANATLESSNASLKSPWMPVWITSGSQTLTIFIANSSASTDYNENEVWVEFYTPDSADTAQHEQNFDPSNARLFASSTAITDDTSSTWGAGGNNHQKLSVAVTPGFEGPAYARLHLAKRQATPDTLYLDPVIEIS